MKKIDISKVISEMVRGSARPVGEDEMAEFLDDCNFDGLQGMVFLPSGDRYLLLDEEHTEKGE